MDAKEQKKAKIHRLFYLGYVDFKDGFPEPENRVKAMGWRHAKREQFDYEQALKAAYELFGELERGEIE
jgi:hypothetical protein